MDNTVKTSSVSIGHRVLVFTILAGVSFLLCSSLSSFVLYPEAPQLDSSVFRYMGMIMQDDGVPYRDSFDHKGPLIYIINYFGLFFGKNGIWYFEYAMLLITAAEIYAVLRFFCQKPLSLVGTCLIVFQLYDFLGGGNYTEEYALPFIVGSLYIFTRFFVEDKTSPALISVCGACCMAVLLLRANMIATWIVFSVAVLIKEIRNNPKQLLFFILYFLLGAFLFFLPFLVYFGINCALDDLWEQYIIFNFSYSETSSNNLIIAVRHFLCTAPCAVATVLCVVCVLLNTKTSHM